jgi:hypothetical protein
MRSNVIVLVHVSVLGSTSMTLLDRESEVVAGLQGLGA